MEVPPEVHPLEMTKSQTQVEPMELVQAILRYMDQIRAMEQVRPPLKSSRAFAVNVVQFRPVKFSRLLKYCKGHKRVETDTPGTTEISKTSSRQVEIG